MMKKDGTLEYYEANAADFAAGTVAVDFTDTQNRFMRLLVPGARILDFGCFTEDSWAQFMANQDFLTMVDYWITTDVRPDRDDEKWLNLMLRK